MRALPLVFLLALVAGGCRTTRPLDLRPDPDPEVVRTLDGLGDHVTGWVQAGPDTLRAARLRIEGGNLLVVPLWGGEARRYPLVEVSAFGIEDPRRSLLYGVLGGVGVAAGVGAVAALLADPSGPDSRSRADTGLRAAAVAGVFTVPFGFVFGVGGGAHQVRFEVVPRFEP